MIAGAWRRPLFVGGWAHSDDNSLLAGETTFNLQTPTVFLDMRVPKAGAARLGHHRGFESMTVKATTSINSINVAVESSPRPDGLLVRLTPLGPESVELRILERCVSGFFSRSTTEYLIAFVESMWM